MDPSGEYVDADQTRVENDLDRFIHLIAHDLRAPIRALTLIPNWIEEDLQKEYSKVPASISEHMRTMANQSRRLDRMLVDLLSYSSVEREHSDGSVNLTDVLDEILLEQGLPDGAKLEQDLAVPILSGGPNNVKALISILVSNGIKHGGGKMAISTKKTGSDVAVIFKDEGPGIAPYFQDKIFEPMTTLQPRDEVEGSGMGLAIARKIMKHHGGTIEIISDEASQGARFIATFPKHKSV